jgi:hypothetical protein
MFSWITPNQAAKANCLTALAQAHALSASDNRDDYAELTGC